MKDSICTNPKCHWEDWFSHRVTYSPPPIGYVNCPLDHGLAGDIENILRRHIGASFFGPVYGVEASALEIASLVSE